MVPVEGSIPPGQSQEFTVTFRPDHPSVNYSDKLTVELMNKVRGAHTCTDLHALSAVNACVLSTCPCPQSLLIKTDRMAKAKTLFLMHSCYLDVLTAAWTSSLYFGLDDITTLILCHFCLSE